MRRGILRVAAAGLALAAPGCGGEADDDDGGAAPRLGLIVDTGCGNFLPVPVAGEAPRTATVTVFGVDPSQPNHRLIDGTEVTIYLGDAEGRPMPVGGRFASTPAGSAPVSAPLAFDGARATDRFHCAAPGGVLVFAVVGRDVTGESPPEYPPASGETPLIRTPRAEAFAIECLPVEDYAARCR